MRKRARLNTQLLEEVKKAFVPIPSGTDPATGGPPGGMDPNAMPPGGGAVPPMDPAMMGGMPPGGAGAPPMDPSMAGGAPPMDPAMMGGMPPDPSMGGAPPMDPAAAGGDPMAQMAAMGIDPSMLGGGAVEEKSIAFSPSEFIQLVAILTGKGGGMSEAGGQSAEAGSGSNGGGAPKPKKASTDDIMNAISGLATQLGGSAPSPVGDGMQVQAAHTSMNKQAIFPMLGLAAAGYMAGKTAYKGARGIKNMLTNKPQVQPYNPGVYPRLGMQKQQSHQTLGNKVKVAYILKRAGFIEDAKNKAKEIWESPLKKTMGEAVEGGKKLVSKGVAKTKELYNKGKEILSEGKEDVKNMMRTKSAAESFAENLAKLKKTV